MEVERRVRNDIVQYVHVFFRNEVHKQFVHLFGVSFRANKCVQVYFHDRAAQVACDGVSELGFEGNCG